MTAALFGRFLLDRAVITEEQLHHANHRLRQRNRSLGQLAIDSGFLSEQDVRTLNLAQRTTDMMLGELAVKRGLLEQDDLERLIILQKATQLSLGELLVESGELTDAELAEQEQAYHDALKASRRACEKLLMQLPHSENVQLCLNELIKGLQRICRQVVAVNMIERDGRLTANLPYVVLQKVSGPNNFHFGFAVSSDQVQRISSSLTGSDQPPGGFIPVSAMEHFSDIVVKNACAKMGSDGRAFESHKPKAFFIGDRMPAYRDMVGVRMMTEEGHFDAMFITE